MFGKLKANEFLLVRMTHEPTERQAKVGTVEEVQGVSTHMFQLVVRLGSLKQQLGPDVTEEGGSVRSIPSSLRSAGSIFDQQSEETDEV